MMLTIVTAAAAYVAHKLFPYLTEQEWEYGWQLTNDRNNHR